MRSTGRTGPDPEPLHDGYRIKSLASRKTMTKKTLRRNRHESRKRNQGIHININLFFQVDVQQPRQRYVNSYAIFRHLWCDATWRWQQPFCHTAEIIPWYCKYIYLGIATRMRHACMHLNFIGACIRAMRFQWMRYCEKRRTDTGNGILATATNDAVNWTACFHKLSTGLCLYLTIRNCLGFGRGFFDFTVKTTEEQVSVQP